MKIAIENAKPGMIVANTIFRENSPIIILNANVALTEKIIEALKNNNIKFLDIQLSKNQEDMPDLDKGVISTISPALKENAKNSIKNFNTSEIIKNAELMTTSIIQSKEFQYDLSEYKQTTDIFSHSIRVASFAILLAKFYNDSLDKFILADDVLKKCKINLESIAVAAMLHDIGKLCEDEEILKKVLKVDNSLEKFFPGIKKANLEKYDEKYVSIYSYLLLNQNPLIKPDIKMMILLANEPENCTGPLEPSEKYIKSRQNFIYGSKIIRLCSIYDDELKQIISENSPLENISAKLDYFAVNEIINNELEKLFFEHVPLYSKGLKVKLSNGEYAVVEQSFHDRMYICRPIVKTVPMGKIIDLRKEMSIIIKEICSDEISFNELVNQQISHMENDIKSL